MLPVFNDPTYPNLTISLEAQRLASENGLLIQSFAFALINSSKVRMENLENPDIFRAFMGSLQNFHQLKIAYLRYKLGEKIRGDFNFALTIARLSLIEALNSGSIPARVENGVLAPIEDVYVVQSVESQGNTDRLINILIDRGFI